MYCTLQRKTLTRTDAKGAYVIQGACFEGDTLHFDLTGYMETSTVVTKWNITHTVADAVLNMAGKFVINKFIPDNVVCEGVF